MKTRKVFFPNRSDIELAAYLDRPDHAAARAWAVLAHCFTCSKNIKSYKHISQALTDQGIGVLRLDFTGIGDSKGRFADTTFATNIDDLVDAGRYLEHNYQAPQLLIGHSLGGVAAIAAAALIPSSRAVVVIGTPDETIHLYNLLSSDRSRNGEAGRYEIMLGGKTFEITPELLDSLQHRQMKPVIETLGRALLVLHAPGDDTVSLGSGERIFAAARQPKSFISLDSADHLLSDENDAYYTGHVIAAWASRYLG